MSSVAKSMTEPFSNDMDTASTMIFEGFIVGWEKWLLVSRSVCRGTHKTLEDRLTSRRACAPLPNPSYTDSHDIPRFPPIFASLHSGLLVFER